MCNVSQTLALSDAVLGLLNPGPEPADPAQYAESLAGLDYSQAQARLSAQNFLADAAASREGYQRKAAQEAGAAHARYGASGFSLDSGSILELMADKNAETGRNSADFTRQGTQEAAKQRLAEEYYGRKKTLLQQEAERNRKNSTLLGGYNNWRSALSPLLQLV